MMAEAIIWPLTIIKKQAKSWAPPKAQSDPAACLTGELEKLASAAKLSSMRAFIVAFTAASAALTIFCGCRTVNNSPVGKGVKTYERYSDEIGKKRDVNVMGKDMVVEPEAARKIRINF